MALFYLVRHGEASYFCWSWDGFQVFDIYRKNESC